MRGRIQLPRRAHEILRVVSLVRPYCNAPGVAFLLLFEASQRGIPFGHIHRGGVAIQRARNQTVAVLHQYVAR